MTRILVVDDNRDGADSACALLRLAGHDARPAYDGDEALAVAAALRPELVLLDLVMPGMQTAELTRRLRELLGLAPARLVALTGRHDGVARAAEAGIGEALLKPAAPEALWGLAGRAACAA